MKKCELLYFPLAGASSLTFRRIGSYFSDTIHAVCYDYPGHGMRIDEAYASDMNSLCADVCEYICKNIDSESEYFLAGHCIGAVLAYEVCKRLSKTKAFKLPKKIIVSGHGAPDRIVSEKLGEMDDDTLIEYLCTNGLADREMMDQKFRKMVLDLIVNPVKQDSLLYDRYIDSADAKIKLNCGIDVFYGADDDRFPKETLKDWEKYTSGQVRFYEFEGNHYFPIQNEKKYFSAMCRSISE